MKCEFYDKCSFVDSESSTCTQDNGGKYCGKYRFLKTGDVMQPAVFEHTADKQPSGKPSKKTPCYTCRQG